MKIKNEEKYLGKIALSNSVWVTDPSYDRKTWCLRHFNNVEPGQYHVLVGFCDCLSWGQRIAGLLAVHEQGAGDGEDWGFFKEPPFQIGVDSGQAGIFDESVFPEVKEKHTYWNDPGTFFGECCILTSSTDQAGILNASHGAVCSSGIGDGVYDVYTSENKRGNIAGIFVDFRLVEEKDLFRRLYSMSLLREKSPLLMTEGSLQRFY